MLVALCHDVFEFIVVLAGPDAGGSCADEFRGVERCDLFDICVAAYGLGLSIYPWSAITQSPLGRNHITLATWTLSYWTVMGVLGYRYRRHLFEGGQRWVTFVLTLIGAAVVTITGTLGGSLGGTPSLVTKSLGLIGWNVYMTFYLPTWMLVTFAASAFVLIVIGVIGARRDA